MQRSIILLTATLVAATPAQAGLFGLPDDKTGHAVIGAMIGASAAAMADSVGVGCLAAIGVGILKEIADGPAGGHQEVPDAAVTGAAGCLASPLGVRTDKRRGATSLRFDQYSPAAAAKLRLSTMGGRP